MGLQQTAKWVWTVADTVAAGAGDTTILLLSRPHSMVLPDRMSIRPAMGEGCGCARFTAVVVLVDVVKLTPVAMLASVVAVTALAIIW